MAQFKASLRDGDGVIDVNISEDNKTITIIEHSNYDDGAIEAGHARSFFTDFRKVTVSSPSKNYIFSSIGTDDPDVTIDTPSVGDSPYSYPIDDVDGNYVVKLISVPTWDAGELYDKNDDFVYYDGEFYKAIQNGTNKQPDAEPNYWTLVAESKLGAKYNTQETVVIACGLEACWEDKVADAVCDIADGRCNTDEILNNKKFVDAMLLVMIRDLIPGRVNALDFAKTSCYLQLSNKICGCNDC